MGAKSQDAEEVGQASSSAAVPPGQRTDKIKKKRRVSRFLRHLKCCGVSDKSNSIDTDEPLVPPKKTSRVDAVALGSAEVEPKPAEAHAAESSMAESKERMGVGLRDSEKTQVGSDAQPEGVYQKEPLVSMPDGSVAVEPVVAVNRDGASTEPRQVEATSPVQPEPPRTGAVNTSTEESLQPSEVQVVVQAPTPVVPQAEELPSPTVDRIEASAPTDGDIVMTDAPPVTQEEVEVPKEPVPDESPSPAVALPPLPPPPSTAVRVPEPPPAPVASNVSAEEPQSVEPQQQWLLPAVPTHLQGRKCLVLDLDETLVHSSFKVRSLSHRRVAG